MRIIDKIKADGVHISFEVFPPKTDAGFESVLKATDGIAELTPSFISVTYGAESTTTAVTTANAYTATTANSDTGDNTIS